MSTPVVCAPGIDALLFLCVRFFSTIELVNALKLEKASGKQGRLALSLMPMYLDILDELGYWPFSQT
jgi:DNA replication protein DnaC